MKVEKKLYEKPTLERLVLIPSENVLAVCSAGTGTGSFGNDQCTIANPCFTPTIQGPVFP